MLGFILRRRVLMLIGAAVAVVLAATVLVVLALRSEPSTGRWAAAPAQTPPAPATGAPQLPASPEPPLPAPPVPAGLKKIDYDPAPPGFPEDPEPLSRTPLTEGLHANTPVGAYDKPGGTAIALLPPDIRGVRLTVPIVARDRGWVAVMVPSVNRRIAWIPPGDWLIEPLRDQIIVERATHTLTWLRDGTTQKSWRVTLGAPATPTPLGRTFIIGRSALQGSVYAGTDVLALGAVPDDVNAIPVGLRGAHIGIHTWHNDRSLGKNTSDGCIRLTKPGQQELLANLAPGTEVIVVDRL